MDLILYPLLFFGSFGALVILLVSAVGTFIWAAFSLLRAIFGVPQGLRELRTRRLKRCAIQADLRFLKRAGA